jgi:uncharacterized protein (TIGR00251 family)
MSVKQIFVKAKPKSKFNAVLTLDNINFEVKVTAPPEDNKANYKIIELLADYFHTAKSNLKIVSGEKSRNKIVEVKQLSNRTNQKTIKKLRSMDRSFVF